MILLKLLTYVCIYVCMYIYIYLYVHSFFKDFEAHCLFLGWQHVWVVEMPVFAGKAVAAGRSGVPGRNDSNIGGFLQQFHTKVQQQFLCSMLKILSSLNFPLNFPSVFQDFLYFCFRRCFHQPKAPRCNVQRSGGYGGGTDPGHRLVEASFRDLRIRKYGGWDGVYGKSGIWGYYMKTMGFQ